MKKLLITLVLSLISFTSRAQTTLLGDVNNDGKVTVADAMMVVDIIIHGYKPFSVEPTTVSMAVGGTATLEISGGYNSYEVTSANTAVVAASLNGTTITLSAISGGKTKVFVKDVQTMRIVEIPVIVDYSPHVSHLTCPDNHHPHLIDLGLPSGTLWSCCNVDTEHPENQSPTNYGGYYAWGEIETKSTYSVTNYRYYSDDYQNIGNDIAYTKYDVAHEKWMGDWRLPSKNHRDELISNCKYEWTKINGVKGGKFTGSNGGSIFLPATGCRVDETIKDDGILGYYWTSTMGDIDGGYGLYFYNGVMYGSGNTRFKGQSVRPVVCQ